MNVLRPIFPLIILAVAGCVSTPAQQDGIADLNQRQIETLQEMQRVQAKIQRDVESLDLVERADVFVGQNEVVVHLYFRTDRKLNLGEKLEVRNEVYAIVTRETGLPKEKIRPLAKKRD
jgi:hypothetical protein